MSLGKIRAKIDRIDFEILDRLNERLELVLRTRKLKPDVRDTEREKDIFSRLKSRAAGSSVLRGDFVETLWSRIIQESRRLQARPLKLIGFQGEHGAFGEAAARCFNPNLVTIPCLQFSDVFEGVESGQLDCGIVPVENSLAGPVTMVNEMLVETPLKVVGAVRHRVSHCLLALPETKFDDVKSVYSHPQALSQCRDFLARHGLDGLPFYDTAGAAKMLASERPKRGAVIADRLCARLYNLAVIEAGIEDHPLNFTRFLVVACQEREEAGNKHSIIFSTPHRAGSLFAVLKLFADSNINLTRIESFPCRSAPRSYAFFLDFQAALERQELGPILDKVKEVTAMFKYLGSYNEEVSQ
ncbi:MAG: prephenate dehydratase [Candidatus Aminicenantes bacterium]|nr:prephenate dehydratase [Candidatus Aminicenantes bacterium]